MRKGLLLVTLAGCLLSVTARAGEGPRVVVLGFDGADAQLVETYVSEGRMPNLASLAAEGSFAPLLPTNPPQTPVSWSTFATGLNPGRTEIFDWLKKRSRRYEPTLCAFDDSFRQPFLWGTRNGWLFALVLGGVACVPALFAFAVRPWRRRLLMLAAILLAILAPVGFWAGTRLVPSSVPAPVNNRKGTTFWEVAVRAGKKATVIHVPVTFPADRLDGLTMISGLGVPDLRATNGQPTVFTTRQDAKSGQFAVAVNGLDPLAGPAWDTRLDGPRNLLFPNPAGTPSPRLTTPLRLEDQGGGRVRMALGDRTSELSPGEWSDWHVVTYRFNALIAVKGMVRIYNQSRPAQGGQAGFTEIAVSPIHPHPSTAALMGWAFPGRLPSDLARRIGLFKTMGWSVDTWTSGDGLASEVHCFEDADYTAAQFERLMETELTAPGTDLFVQVFEFTDRVQHLAWRFTDPASPGYDPALAIRHGHVIRDAYEAMDRIIGRARALVPKEAVFMVVSDHGFASFRRGINLNRWLVDHGFMVLRRDPCLAGLGSASSLDDIFEDQGGVFSDVDWSRTRAYALGLGNISINLAGREPEGIVRPGAEYDALLTDIARGLESLVDPTTGASPVRRVYRRDEMYRGYDPEIIPDLRVANTAGYRVSWDTAAGGIGCEQIVDNDRPWGGDHCSLDPEEVLGILVSSEPLAARRPEMADLAPTILSALGLEPPRGLDGTSLR